MGAAIGGFVFALVFGAVALLGGVAMIVAKLYKIVLRAIDSYWERRNNRIVSLKEILSENPRMNQFWY